MTSFSGSRRILLFAAMLALCGCAAARVPASEAGIPSAAVTASPPATVEAGTIGRDARIAVFPVENLSGTAAPTREVTRALKTALAARGWSLLDDPALDRFMEKYRVRYTGGLTRELAKAFRKELEVDGVLISSIDLFGPADPPKIGIAARLVSTGEETAIRWADGASMAGDESPGLLGLGRVTDPGVLMDKVVERILRSLEGRLSGRAEGPGVAGAEKPEGERGYRGTYLPRGSFRHPDLRVPAGPGPARVAVLPFLDRSGRPHAGEVMANHFLRGFAAGSGVGVVEPGAVRQALLQSRLIMEGGLSFPQADILREIVGVDYVVTGEVMEFQDPQGYEGTPYVEFSVYVIDANRRQVVWTSTSHNRGDDRVYLFDWGKTYTTGAMVSEMVRAVTHRFLRP